MDAAGEGECLAGGGGEGMKTVADFWEDHCVECGEPVCFKSCPKFRRGAHGRCERVEMPGGGCARFREWGKLELLWHGRMASPAVAKRLNAWNARLEPIARLLQKVLRWIPFPYGRGPYGIFRSLRWRCVRHCSRLNGMPAKWRFAASSKSPVALVMEVRSAGGDVLLLNRVETGADPEEVTVDLPRIEEGTLFSVRPADPAAEAEVVVAVNELYADEEPEVKCVAWDLDGVLWKGTLSEGDAVVPDGRVLDVIRALDARGVANSICSKNDEADAIAKLEELGVEELFVFPQINWGPKSESLKRLATEMNIGLDAIAFVDDREENRAEVRDRLPQVRVFAETELAALCACAMPSASAGLGSRRRMMYRDEMKRRKAAAAFGGDAEAFAAASGIKHELLSVEGGRADRCLELVQRTNQLNLTAHRYGREEFGRLLAEAECRAVHVWDRYGDYGVVGFVAWKGTRLVECCFSCRVAKRGVERKVLDEIAGGRRFSADVVETERNGPIREIVREWIDG
ncbi:MAG: HAD-IIIC family phosphatase [Kiritimatiellae bacterium]|nr:HAD-IIIC family phosphatase [Kiritimatiellia bacterium]